MAIDSIKYTVTWDKYKTIVNIFKDSFTLYRGHENSHWNLISTFHRDQKNLVYVLPVNFTPFLVSFVVYREIGMKLH